MDWQQKSRKLLENEKQHDFDWLQKLNRSIAYIESHLDGTVDYSEAAKIAVCSVYHYQRFFSYIAEIPLSEYIRRRRLTLAAFELQSSDSKVIDIALKYGYDTPEAFSRAFKNMHDVAPTSARNRRVLLKAYPRISFNISIKGDTEMKYRVEECESLEMYGVEAEICTIDNQNFTTVPEFWKTCRTDGTMDKIREASNLEANVPLHAAIYNCTNMANSYMIGYFSPPSGSPKDFTTLSIPASTWAIFPTEPLSMAEAAEQAGIMWKRIFIEWFATSGYQLAPNVPEMELHYNKGNGQFVTEIWIPVEKKK
ncbi:MAG: AraC family transcriptional regulator [Firmicutes bacterium HGW-Firmicutes-4]|jgi:AraC family transcriptional regulator|nr:MAG: AraC family transcriptional regulator [Firmicutes bacterium HGW-Firmicutes-4]